MVLSVPVGEGDTVEINFMIGFNMLDSQHITAFGIFRDGILLAKVLRTNAVIGFSDSVSGSYVDMPGGGTFEYSI